MYIRSERQKGTRDQSRGNKIGQMGRYGEPTAHFLNNRPDAIAQRKLGEMVNKCFSGQRQSIQKKGYKTVLTGAAKTAMGDRSNDTAKGVEMRGDVENGVPLQAHPSRGPQVARVGQRVSNSQVIQLAWYDCFLCCLPFLRRSSVAQPLLSQQIGSVESEPETEIRLEERFREFVNTEEDYERLESACEDNDIGGVCTAMTVDWFTHILAGGNIERNPIQIPRELKRLVQAHMEYRGKAIKSRRGMDEYMETKGLRRSRVPEGDDEYVEGWIDMKTGQIGEMDYVELDEGGMYMIDFGDRGGEGIGHTIGLYSNGEQIVVRDQNIGQQILGGMEELAVKYSKVFAAIAKERESDLSIPLYRKWALYKVDEI